MLGHGRCCGKSDVHLVRRDLLVAVMSEIFRTTPQPQAFSQTLAPMDDVASEAMHFAIALVALIFVAPLTRAVRPGYPAP